VARIIRRRIENNIEDTLANDKFGYRRGREISDVWDAANNLRTNFERR
jgi:hypothetical protein